MQNEEIIQELTNVKAELEKVKLEISTKDAAQEATIKDQQQKITTLQSALEAAQVTDPAVLAALEDVKAAVKSIDDLNADATVLEPITDTPAEQSTV